MSLSQRIKQARENAGLSISTMQDVLNISETSYRNLEKNANDIKVTQLQVIASATGENFAYLATGDAPKTHQLHAINALINNAIGGLTHLSQEINTPKSDDHNE